MLRAAEVIGLGYLPLRHGTPKPWRRADMLGKQMGRRE